MNSGRRKAWLFTTHSPREIFSSISAIGPGDLIVAVDGGLERIDGLGLAPSVVIGDFDSLDPRLLEKYPLVPQLRHPTAKNETDTELAVLWALEQEVGELVICNDFGGRIDHALGLVQNLALSHSRGLCAAAESENQRIFFLDRETRLEGHEGCLLSLLAWGGTARFAASGGLLYSLDGLELSSLRSRGISNRIDSPQAWIRLSSGQALAILTK